jgi:hypothetical protein
VLKLLLASLGILGLLEYTQALGGYRGEGDLFSSDLGALRNPAHLIQFGGGLLILLTATARALYKPPGLTRYAALAPAVKAHHRPLRWPLAGYRARPRAPAAAEPPTPPPLPFLAGR